jgi:ABC-type multidrug transport system permease subunit
MWTFAIPAVCVLAHLYLVVIFLPGFWREIDTRGLRWWSALGYFVVPLVSAALIVGHVVSSFATMDTWLLVAAFLTVDALLISTLLVALGLRGRRQRPA